MLFRISLFFCLAVISKYSWATTFITSQDGEWGDSSSWNNISIPDTLDSDTIIISHHIYSNNNIVLSNSYMQIDSLGSICGHDSIWFFNSKILIHGGFYADFVYGDDSEWLAHYASWLVSYWLHWGGMSHFQLMLCPLARVGGCFVCTIPVELCPDTTQTIDTIIILPPKLPPLSISIYPTPSFDHFIIDSEIPDSNSQIILNIFNLIGRKMKTIPIHDDKSSLTVFTNGWAAGMYILKFQTGENILQTDKIIKVK